MLPVAGRVRKGVGKTKVPKGRRRYPKSQRGVHRYQIKSTTGKQFPLQSRRGICKSGVFKRDSMESWGKGQERKGGMVRLSKSRMLREVGIKERINPQNGNPSWAIASKERQSEKEVNKGPREEVLNCKNEKKYAVAATRQRQRDNL